MIECNKKRQTIIFGGGRIKILEIGLLLLLSFEKNVIIIIAVGGICVMFGCGNLTILQIYKNCYFFLKSSGKFIVTWASRRTSDLVQLFRNH